MEDYLTSLILLLLVGRILGLSLRRLHLESMIGEILAGVALGLLFFPNTSVAGWVGLEVIPSEPLRVIANFGVLMLMLLSGILTDFRAFRDNLLASVVVGGLGVVVTFAFIFVPAQMIFHSWKESLFVAAILSNTAIEVCARLLMESPRSSRFKSVLMGASFVDDIIAVFLIGLVSSAVFGEEQGIEVGGYVLDANVWARYGLIALVIGVFLLLSMTVGQKVVEWVFGKVQDSRVGNKALLTATLITGAFFAVVARNLWLHEVIGAYIGGLLVGRWGSRVGPMLRRRIAYHKLVDDIDPPLRAIFGPIFFGLIGLELIHSVAGTHGSWSLILGTSALFIVLALAGKLAGCGVGAKLMNFQWRDAVKLGAAMGGRGALELVLLSFGLQLDVITGLQFAVLAITTMGTMLLTPLLVTLLDRTLR